VSHYYLDNKIARLYLK